MTTRKGQIEDDPWERFLEIIVAGLGEAARRVRGERRAHFEGRAGWFGKERADFGGSRIPRETSISAAIVETLRLMRARQLVEGVEAVPGLDLTRVECHTEVPRKHEAGIGDASLPTDIMLCVVQDDLDMRIEAKNVLSKSDVTGEYVTERGLRRFDDIRSPYSSERFGGMIAYIMDDDLTKWSAEITAGLRGARPAFELHATTISGKAYTTTRHDRIVNCLEHGIQERRVTNVLHLVFPFNADPPLVARQGSQRGTP